MGPGLCVRISFSTAFADVPQVISYQGRLTDTNSGKPLDGEFDVTFRLYTVKDGVGVSIHAPAKGATLSS